MAMMSMFYEIQKHATAFPSNVVSGEGAGHLFSIKLTSDCDNGNLIAVGPYLSLDLFEEAVADSFDGEIVQQMGNGNYLVMVNDPGNSVLVYQVPVGAEEYNHVWTRESNLFNKAGDIVRCYELKKWDRFEVSAEGFEGTPEVGAKITGVSNKKMVIG